VMAPILTRTVPMRTVSLIWFAPTIYPPLKTILLSPRSLLMEKMPDFRVVCTSWMMSMMGRFSSSPVKAMVVIIPQEC
jgi:hypothetical protein